MTGWSVALAVAVAGSATVAPALRRRARWRRVLTGAVAGPAPNWQARWTRRGRALVAELAAPHRRARAAACVGVAAALVGLILGGPMAAAVLAGYAGAGLHLIVRRRQRQAAAQAAAAAADAVSSLAAELRAGVPAVAALRSAREQVRSAVGPRANEVAARLAAVVEVAESSGAPLADLLERFDAHVRAVDRAQALADAQAAGARASAALLAVLPLAGAGLGFLVGVDAVHVLLHTRLGAACLGAAVVLQLTGLAWSGRLSRVEVTV